MSRINTNVSALNAQRQLMGAQKDFGRVVGRLSSGFRINRAADDAAGLGIANSLRGRIRGLTAASRNAEQANSLLQVAEGGAQQVQGILERMKELAVQSASDNVNDDDRALINQEFTQLQSEATRIVSTTKFQGNTLLNGSLGNEVDTVATNADDAVGVYSVEISGTSADTYSITAAAGGDITIVADSDPGVSQTLTAVDGRQTLNFSQFGITIETDSSFAIGDQTLDGDDIVVASPGGNAGEFIVSDSGSVVNDTVAIDQLDLRLSALGIDSDALDTKANAQTALANIDAAINVVSAEFGKIGAAQNRLDFAKANVDTTLENFSAAESVIRDADMAAEATELARVQILQQAATAVLAQANQSSQGVLQLLR
jgi:flagellin